MMLEQLKQRLENNPRLSHSTIRVYLIQINSLIKTYGESPTIEHLNQFIAEKCRKRQPAGKYAIKEYLIMLGRGNEYTKLVQAKIKRPIRPKVFLTKDKLKDIIDSIEKEPYRTIGRLQMAFAARASGIISIERKRIRKEEGRIRFTLTEKGDKPKVVYLRLEMWPLIEPYYNQPNKYIFLKKEAEGYTTKQLNLKISNEYMYYLRQLKEAARKNNIELSTHDVRRSVANLINNSTNDPRIAQKLLGHQSIDTTEKYLEDNSKEVTSILLDYQYGL